MNSIKYTTDNIPRVIKPSAIVKGVEKREVSLPTPMAMIVYSKATGGSKAVSCMAIWEFLYPLIKSKK